MKELKIEVPQGYEIDREQSTFEKIIFKKIKDELPKTWEEFCEQNPITNTEFYINSCSGIVTREYSLRHKFADKTLLSTKEDAEAYIALMQLHRLRDVYRQGWKPDWNDYTEKKYCIYYIDSSLLIEMYKTYHFFLSFQSQEIAEKFLKNFKDLIEKAKDLL